MGNDDLAKTAPPRESAHRSVFFGSPFFRRTSRIAHVGRSHSAVMAAAHRALVQFFATLGYQGSYTMTAPDQIGSDANRPAPGGCTIRSSVELRLRRSGYAALAGCLSSLKQKAVYCTCTARCRRFT